MMSEKNLKHIGWGIAGKPKDGVIVQTAEGRGIDVTGYSTADYWQDGKFLGPDEYGIVPVYQTQSGRQFPAAAKSYPYRA